MALSSHFAEGQLLSCLVILWFLGYVCLHPEGQHLISALGFYSNKYIVDAYLARSYNDKFNPTVWTVIFIWVKFAKCLLEFCTVRNCSLVPKSAMFVEKVNLLVYRGSCATN